MSKQGGTFEGEMQKFKAIQLLSPLKAITAHMSDTQPMSKDARFQMALECIKSGAVVADLGLMQDLLRYCAIESKPIEAMALLKQMPKDYGVQPTEYCKEILAYAQLKAGDQDAALTTLASLKEITNRTKLMNDFYEFFSGSICCLEDVERLLAA